MKARLAALALPLTMLTAPVQSQNPMSTPDLVILNAAVHTMDAARPTADAVAIF